MYGIPDMMALSPAVPQARGNVMVVPPMSILPARCIVCNAECSEKADGQLDNIHARTGAGTLAGYAIGGGVGALIGSAIQAKSTGTPAGGIWLHYCICPQHRAVQRRGPLLLLKALPIILALAILVGWLVWYPAGMAVFAFGMIAIAIRTRRIENRGGVANLVVSEVRDGLAMIEGVGEPYLKSLESANAA